MTLGSAPAKPSHASAYTFTSMMPIKPHQSTFTTTTANSTMLRPNSSPTLYPPFRQRPRKCHRHLSSAPQHSQPTSRWRYCAPLRQHRPKHHPTPWTLAVRRHAPLPPRCGAVQLPSPCPADALSRSIHLRSSSLRCSHRRSYPTAGPRRLHHRRRTC